MDGMPTALTFTIAEAAEVLNPPMTERQLRGFITLLRWQPEGWRKRDTPGHPFPTYDWEQIAQLHAALVPFLH